jgi:hypothetical protein
MGMFDTIKCDYPLPVTTEMLEWGLDMQNMNFQTKDLENLLEEYVITPEGEFLFIKHTRKWVDDDSAFLKGYFEIVDTEIVPANYHGIVYFYCYEKLGVKDGKHYVISAEYEAKFIDNKLVNLELFDQEIIDDTEHVLRMKEFDKQREIEANKWYNKFIFNTKVVRKIRRAIHNIFYKLYQFTGKLHTWSIKHI